MATTSRKTTFFTGHKNLIFNVNFSLAASIPDFQLEKIQKAFLSFEYFLTIKFLVPALEIPNWV